MFKSQKDLLKAEEAGLAPYATKSRESVGRVYEEKEDPTRLPFQRDRDRIIHCKAFRRLQAKTQVFVSYYGDHYRDRLTHTIEVSQVARDIARSLGLNEDLAEAVALAHDLGHPPFGHGGEEALNDMMQNFGLHFEHNEQSRRIVEKLEKLYPSFDGLNLTKETLDGLLKHEQSHHLAFTQFTVSPHLESQVADLSDEIAYTNHDIDDGLRSGIITITQMREFELWRVAEQQINKEYGNQLDLDRFKSRVISRMITNMIRDLCSTTQNTLQELAIQNVAQVREHHSRMVEFSPKLRTELIEMRRFLMAEFYLHPKVAEKIVHGKHLLKELFSYYLASPHKLPEPFAQNIQDGEAKEVVIKDYIAGMTDHFAEETGAELKINNL